MRKLLITIWVLVSTHCLGGEIEKKAIEQTFPQKSIVSSSVGLIEGNQHLAAVVSDGNQSEIAIVVFELERTRNYKLRSRSAWFATHQRWYDTSVKIRNDSVYFSRSGNGGCCSDYFAHYQFKPRDGKFSLVGLESSNVGVEPKSDVVGYASEEGLISYSYGSSINYLTGVVSHWRVQAPSSSESAFKDDIATIKVGKKRVEKRFNFALPQNLLLEAFDIWADSETEGKHLRGYFDQHFNYRE